jgi:hypothetical protein
LGPFLCLKRAAGGGACRAKLICRFAKPSGAVWRVCPCSPPPAAVQYLREDRSMGAKIAIVAYCLAVGFILAVAFHLPSKQMVAASEPVLTPVVDLK